MSEQNQRAQPVESMAAEQMVFASEQISLTVTLVLSAGVFRFEWFRANAQCVAHGELLPTERGLFAFYLLQWIFECNGRAEKDSCTGWPSSVSALLKRIQKRMPVTRDAVRLGLVADQDLGQAKAGILLELKLPPGADVWRWLGREILEFARLLDSSLINPGPARERGQRAMYLLACALLKVAPEPTVSRPNGRSGSLLNLRVTFDQVRKLAEFAWTTPQTGAIAALGTVRCTGPDQLLWDLEIDGRHDPAVASCRREVVRGELNRWLKRFPTSMDTFAGFWVSPQGPNLQPLSQREPPFGPDESPYQWMEDNICDMAEALGSKFPAILRDIAEMAPLGYADYERYERRVLRKEQRRAEEELRRQEILARKAAEREKREAERRAALKAVEKVASPLPSPAKARPPLPAIPLSVEMPPLSVQDTAFAIADLRDYSLRERAALWWVSNQSDDLLCLPYCRIEHLDYQVRAALRVLGPLRGRALLSDEVGLGKTIEAGLVIKELLTRGMVKRFLVLTVPSLVDQWEEELRDKFGLETATTNEPAARSNAQGFWQTSNAVIASLHTLKQPAHLGWASQVHWDILVVDEAHYLRNRDSQAWQAVNALPRQFLLLLTATPVQNSLEELYNLVTLLQPGQLPSPKEFRSRFLDPKRPRQPRQPEELRRLLGQVMIRNTRANSGVHLPPRRAETVSFQPDTAESAFWQSWETEFRRTLRELNPGQASLWGRLVLQAAGSSPFAWRAALAKFPQAQAAGRWREQAPLAESWRRKCQLIPPLTRGEGGVVIFTQFLETQSALASFLEGANVQRFVINGSTPPTQRQPITEDFRRAGGALLLTHSGTEGRNLQFCHRLVNFDLPWNPMEIEQRIGRLHRLGQQQPVSIYNFVQTGTLQEQLLYLLQEKLNLFELVVGETGLILGEEFSSEEFAEEILLRWRDSEGQVAEAFAKLGDQLASARRTYGEVKKLDETLFAEDYES